MLILSQDKELITEDLNLVITEETFRDIGKGYIISNEKYKLAFYATEERAKEVLREIIEMYIDCNEQFDSSGLGYIRNKVYEMPEK